MQIFDKNGIIERLLPSFGSKRVEYECFLLSSIMAVLLIRKNYPVWFKESNMLFEMIQATLPFYESTGLNSLNNPKMDEEKITKYIFERWGKYERSFVDPSRKDDFSDIHDLVFECKGDNYWVVKNIDISRLNFKISILECTNLMVNFGENSTAK
jgi:hypothetical protein